MSDALKIVGYYTGGYAREAGRLRASLVRLGLQRQTHLQEMPDVGVWRANAHLRPWVLGAMRLAWPQAQLLSLDADAVVWQDPRPLCRGLAEACDVAVGVLGQELLPGTLLLNPTEGTDAFLAAWSKINVRQGEEVDRMNFRQALRETQGLRLKKLPPAYCWIFDLSAKMYSEGYEAEIAIEHLQASRQLAPHERPDPRLEARIARVAEVDAILADWAEKHAQGVTA